MHLIVQSQAARTSLVLWMECGWKNFTRGFWENSIFAFCNGVIFTHPCIFRRFFWQISLKRSVYVENWRKRTAFFFDFGSRWVPEKELMSEFNRKVARNNGTRVFRSYQHGDIFYLFSLFEDVSCVSLYCCKLYSDNYIACRWKVFWNEIGDSILTNISLFSIALFCTVLFKVSL